jgi:hypothetical protein
MRGLGRWVVGMYVFWLACFLGLGLNRLPDQHCAVDFKLQSTVQLMHWHRCGGF